MCCFFILSVLCYICINFAFSFCRFIIPGIIINYILHYIIYSFFKRRSYYQLGTFCGEASSVFYERGATPPLYSPFRLCLEIYIENTGQMVKMLLHFPSKIWIKKLTTKRIVRLTLRYTENTNSFDFSYI